ncbi:hypothetical protein DL763_001122 [Monosporascus cannonballus]|nr:hypothetical protein DL763_001122 [Monosporascus cannonballus]
MYTRITPIVAGLLTAGIWAPTLRYRDETFWLVTTLVDDDRAADDASRWDNTEQVIFEAADPYDPASWSNAVHFDFEGYDTEPFWDVDGKSYITGAHAWKVGPRIELAEANLGTGEIGEWRTIWNGTGGLARGTGIDHMATMARSKSIHGPYESNPANPVLSNADTTEYFQAVGHADLFQDASGNWWGVALSVRSGPLYMHFPMVRETVMVPVTWSTGEFPVWSPVRGEMSGWPFPPKNTNVEGPGPFIVEGDEVDFEAGSTLPAHFTHWRFPRAESFTVSPPEQPNSLRINPSRLNLTALNGNYAGPEGQSFVGRRQQDTLFTYNVNLDFHPSSLEEEAGVSVFLTQNHHLDLGVVMLPSNNSTATFPYSGNGMTRRTGTLIPHLRFRGESYVPVPDDIVAPLPEAWLGRTLRLEIRASNMTHYSLSAGPADAMSQMRTILDVSNEPVSWGFTGVILGIYCTTNGRNGKGTPAYFSKWRYVPQGQYRN